MAPFGPPDVGALKARGKARAVARALRYRHDSTVRRAAARALGDLGDRAAAPALIGSLADEDSSVRAEAARALGRLGDPAALQPLCRSLQDQVPEVRAAAAVALAEIRGAGAVSGLLNAMADEPVDSVVDEIVRSLVRLGDPAAVQPLLDIVRDRADGATREVADSLCATPEQAPHLGEAAALYSLARGRFDDPGNSQRVLRLVIDNERFDRSVREHAIRALGQRLDDDQTHFLASLLTRPETHLQRTALDCLDAAGWEPDDDRLRAARFVLRGEARRLRELDADTIGSVLADAMAWPTSDWLTQGIIATHLLRSRQMLEPSTRARADDAVAAMCEEYQRRLEELFSNGSAQISRSEAASLFGDYHDLVREAAGSVSPRAVEELCRIDTPAATNLLHHVSDMADIVSERVVEVEYDVDHPRGEEFLTQVWSCEDRRTSARRELAARGNPDYDRAVYSTPNCWQLPASTGVAEGHG